MTTDLIGHRRAADLVHGAAQPRDVVRMETPKLRALRRAVRMVSGPVTLNDSEMAES